ncbi:MAG: TonB-dependent receptor [Bacteroidota bacterium]|nr:TonB-dependent receptor [Bacteroidota bacterium]
MYKKYSCFLLVFFLYVHPVFAVQLITVSGYIRDAKTGEDLIGATVSIKELSGKGSGANAYGYYSISLPSGHYQLTAQYMGYEPQVQQIDLTHPQKIDFLLTTKENTLNEVVVTSQRKNDNITKLEMGVQKLDTKDIKNIPVLFGEKDVLKTIQLLPGIKSAGEGSSGFNVRGGGADQNLILLDEATVYNASHLMGFFSVFNSDAIKDISVYKGNEPAEYGGRLSSALDIKMNDGNDKKLGVSGGIGLISSRLTVEGPLVTDKGSFIISARRTYADLFLKLSSDTTLNKAQLYFYDFNAKANYRIDNKNRIYLSGYFGKDVLGFGNTFGINWGNSTATLRWNHLFSDRLFSNTSAIFSNYDYRIDITNEIDLNIISRIRDYSLKQDFQLFSGTDNTLKFGFNSVYHKIIPGAITASSDVDLKSLTNKNAWENAFYISHEHTFSDKFSVEYGARLSTFSLLGSGNFYTYDSIGNPKDTTYYKSGQVVKTYINLEPRITFNYILNPQSSLKAAYARNVQNLHLLSNTTSGNPTDLWIPSSNNVKPEIADQVSMGFYHNFNDNLYEFSAEVYYKHLQNQIDYKNGAELNFNENVESQILFGTGRAYGLELFLKKKYGRFNGWISYDLSRTERKFAAINNGNYYPARQDRTHDISIVGMYELSKRWTLSTTWVYNTGNAVTFPTGKYEIDGKTVMLYSERNANRMPAYHRLDFGATWIVKKTRKFESSWTFSLYNAYGQENAYTINFRNNEKDPTRTEAVQTTLFRFVPSFSYNFKF